MRQDELLIRPNGLFLNFASLRRPNEILIGVKMNRNNMKAAHLNTNCVFMLKPTWIMVLRALYNFAVVGGTCQIIF